jgi:hypothetical protein
MSIGAKVEPAPLDLTGLSASYLVANAASATGFDRVAASASANGTWTSALRDPAPVEVTVPEDPPHPRLYLFPTTSLSLQYQVLEHPNRSPATDGAMLAVTATLEAPSTVSDIFDVFTVGSWTTHPLASGVADLLEVALTYPFGESTSLSGRPQLDRLTMQDAFLILRHTGAALTGVAEPAAFDQTGDDTVTATMVPVAQDKTLELTFDSAVLGQRYLAVRPAVATLALGWSLVAAPGYKFASNVGPVLHGGRLMATDVGVTAMYGNPFAARGWNTILTFASSESRPATPAMMTLSTTLFAGTAQFSEPSVADTVMIDAGLPELIQLDDRPLSTDGLMIAKPTRFAKVSFIADAPNNTLYSLQVLDLVPNGGATALEGRLVYEAQSNDKTFYVPPETFQVGHAYTLRAVCTQGGFPAIGDGNLQNRQLPLSQAFLDSGVFTVMP